MPTRRAILIAYPGDPNKSGDYCKGVLKDMDNYEAYLKSPIGGYWYGSEIETLITRTATEVRAAISHLSDFDYSVIVYSGHGYYSTSRSSTIIALNKTEEIDTVDLRNNRSPKHTLVLDCCRKKEGKEELKEFREFVKTARQVDGTKCRDAYNDWLDKCSRGMIVMNSCRPDEISYDHPITGAFYISQLIVEAERWSKSVQVSYPKYDVYTDVQAHDASEKPVTDRSGGDQHPVLEKPKTMDYVFPYTVMT